VAPELCLGGETEPWNAAVYLGAEYGLSWSALCGQIRNLDLVDENSRVELVRRVPGISKGVARYPRLEDQTAVNIGQQRNVAIKRTLSLISTAVLHAQISDVAAAT